MVVGLGGEVASLPIASAACKEIDIIGSFRYCNTVSTPPIGRFAVLSGLSSSGCHRRLMTDQCCPSPKQAPLSDVVSCSLHWPILVFEPLCCVCKSFWDRNTCRNCKVLTIMGATCNLQNTSRLRIVIAYWAWANATAFTWLMQICLLLETGAISFCFRAVSTLPQVDGEPEGRRSTDDHPSFWILRDGSARCI